MDAAVAHLGESLEGAVACAPRGAVGPAPGRHSGQWLTSVMLALCPELVQLDQAGSELAAELQASDAHPGAAYVKRFVDSLVEVVRDLVP